MSYQWRTTLQPKATVTEMPKRVPSMKGTHMNAVRFFPDCSTCGHNASGVLGGPERGRCAAFRAYPPGDPRGMAGYCNCPCSQDPVIRAWLEEKAHVSDPSGDAGREQSAAPDGGEAAP